MVLPIVCENDDMSSFTLVIDGIGKRSPWGISFGPKIHPLPRIMPPVLVYNSDINAGNIARRRCCSAVLVRPIWLGVMAGENCAPRDFMCAKNSSVVIVLSVLFRCHDRLRFVRRFAPGDLRLRFRHHHRRRCVRADISSWLGWVTICWGRQTALL